MKKLFIPLVAAFAVLAACCSDKTQTGYTISGQIDDLNSDSVWLFKSQYDSEPAAAAAVKNGAFKLTGETDEPSLGAVISRSGILCDLIVEDGNIVIARTGPNPDDIEITGSPANDAVTRDYARLTELFKDVPCEDAERQQQLIRNLWEEGAKANRDNFYGVLCVMNLMERIPEEQVQALYDGLSDKMKATESGAVIQSFLDQFDE